jgi:hypothetical protein
MNRVSRLGAVIACAFSLLALTAASASAFPPPNDDFSNPSILTPLSPVVGNNIDAANDVDEAARLQAVVGWAFHGAVWNSYTATQAGDVSFTICSDAPSNNLVVKGNSIYDLQLAQHLGGISQKQALSQGGDGCGPADYGAALGPFHVHPGDTLRPVVSSAYSGQPLWYAANTTFTPAPANDDFDSRTQIRSRIAQTGTNVAASTEQDEANNPYANYRTVWYEYKPVGYGGADIEVCADFPVNVVAYTGTSLDSLTDVAAGQGWGAGGCSGNRYAVTLPGVATADYHETGESLKIQVGGYTSPNQTGNFDIEVRQNGAPSNDAIYGSRPFEAQSASGTEYGDNTYATTNTDFMDASIPGFAPAGQFPDIGKTVFFEYHADSSGEFTFDTCGSAVDTVVQAFWRPNYYPPISSDAYADDGCPTGGGSQLQSFWAAPGAEAVFRVGSKANGPGGAIVTNVVWDPEPGNNSFDSATEISGGDEIVGTVKGANPEGYEQNNATGGIFHSVWYRFQAPSNGIFTFDTCDADFDSVVTAWTGSEISNLSQLGGSASANNGCDSGSGSKLANVPVRSGKSVWFQVDGATAADRGNFTASLSFTAAPANDEWADATDLGNADAVNRDATSAHASADFDPDSFNATGPAIGGQYRSASVWFKWTAPYSTNVYVDTCSGSPTGYDGWMTVYRRNGSEPIPPYYNLLDVNNDDDGCNGSGRPKMPKLSFAADEGQTYWIAVAARTTNPDSGTDFTLRINTPAYPKSAPEISAPNLVVGTQLSTSDGGWGGSTPISHQYRWIRCDGDGSNCSDIAGADQSTYTLAPADAGHKLRVRVSASNAFGGDYSESSVTGLVIPDDDGDGVGNPDDTCPNHARDTGKPNGCPQEVIVVDAQATITGNTVVGSTLTGNYAFSAADVDPTVGAIEYTFKWLRCDAPDDCTEIDGAESSTYTLTGADLGKTIKFRANADNGDHYELSISAPTAAITAPVQPPNPPATPDPLDLSKLKLPKKASASKLVKTKGKFTIKAVQFACPAGGGACTIKLSYSAKVKKKSKKLGSSTLVIPAGTTKPLSGKLSSAGLKLLKKQKKLVATIAVTGSGGATGKATLKAFTIKK